MPQPHSPLDPPPVSDPASVDPPSSDPVLSADHAALSEVDLLMRVARRWRHLGSDSGGESADGDRALSPHQARALLALARMERRAAECGHPHGIRVSHLAAHLGIAPRSATEVADALEELGLVERAPDPTDRRAVLLTLTGEGRHTVGVVRDRRRAAAEEALAALAEPDRAELRRLLLLLLDND
ncbi:MarR family winged helix-turn-helix transcriptional regulator [Ornithinimicrobium sp. Y1847]|uniref:MarR family winged helix-turn-helix transcriptional regulator n=1 Tax=Ornithinimicrobium sp. Y1847 TaxID=3405419 RepID=UPI003B67517F